MELSKADSRQTLHRLRSFYVLLDTLRSIHLHTPSTVEPTWSVQIGLGGKYDLRRVCEALVLDQSALPSDLRAEEHLLVLNSLLADTHTLLCSLGQFTRTASVVRENIMTLRRRDQEATWLPQLSTSAMLYQSDNRILNPYRNPYVPFTADYEFSRTRSGIAKALILWQSSFQSQNGARDNGALSFEHSIIPLLHFTRLLLVVGPAVYELSSLSGYPPEEDERTSNAERLAPHKVGIHIDDEAVETAADILESVNYERNLSRPTPTDGVVQYQICPMWYPLPLFYGALVVWARYEEEKAKNAPNHVLLPSRRLLQMFHTALASLKEHWGCAHQMAGVISELI